MEEGVDPLGCEQLHDLTVLVWWDTGLCCCCWRRHCSTEHRRQGFIEIYCVLWSQWIITKPLSGSRPMWKLNCEARGLGGGVHYRNFWASFRPCSCHLKSDGRDKPKIHFSLFRKQCCTAYFINRLEWLPICNKCCSSCIQDFSNTSLELCQINTPNVLPTAPREWCCLILDRLVWDPYLNFTFKSNTSRVLWLYFLIRQPVNMI